MTEMKEQSGNITKTSPSRIVKAGETNDEQIDTDGFMVPVKVVKTLKKSANVRLSRGGI